jgi:hypothetical protein
MPIGDYNLREMPPRRVFTVSILAIETAVLWIAGLAVVIVILDDFFFATPPLFESSLYEDVLWLVAISILSGSFLTSARSMVSAGPDTPTVRKTYACGLLVACLAHASALTYIAFACLTELLDFGALILWGSLLGMMTYTCAQSFLQQVVPDSPTQGSRAR